jgi:antigen 43
MGMGNTCFMSGARVRAARGEIEIDQIEPGDEVVVVRNGQETLEPVKWIGHTYVDIARYEYPEEAAPIRFLAGAIAENQPARDLIVSPEHCLIIDGLCVPAKLLVNGGSIVSERGRAPFTYYHLELEKHGILLAENTPTESYLDTGNRSTFDNADEPRQLYPSFQVNEGHLRWETDACAPLAKVPEEVEPIWARLAERSISLGYAPSVIKTAGDPKLHLVADGQIILPISDRDARYTFAVPAGVSSVTLKSLFCIPADKMVAAQRDTRRLGMKVNWIAIRSDEIETIIPADHPGLKDGWNDIEKDDRSIWRWTDGSATIPWHGLAGSAVVTVRCFPVDQYPTYDEQARLVA